MARAAPQLSADEVDQLAHTLETGGRLQITYCSASGAVTHRVIRDPDLEDSMIYAWCELRRHERVFTVAGILSVTAAG